MLRRTATLVLGLFCALQLKAQNSDLLGIAHVAFRVGDYQKSRGFYETLGFEQAFEFADPGKPRVSFMKINDHQFIELYEGSDDSQTGLMHICFETSDIESLRRAYAKAGLQPTEIKKIRAGNLLFVMHDPERQLLEYTQYMPGSLHSLDKGKHLGERRISEHLVQSSTPAQDFATELAFYTSKLGFRPAASGEGELRLPGKSGARIELLAKPAGNKPRIVFTVNNLSRTARDLRSRGLELQKQGKDVYTADPDGTLLVFTARRGDGGTP
jgi:catechol 2,3-dioxygenase-like lactoylglutathione lyase family enzyme